MGAWNRLQPVWWAPRDSAAAAQVPIAKSPDDFPKSDGVVVATAAKWARSKQHRVDLMIVDEAWQMSFAQLAPLLPLADRLLLVGDPGQIAPVVQVDTTRWSDDPAGPHRPAPEVLRRRPPARLVEVALPATRRLPADTAAVVSDAFYPELPFGSLATPRRLECPDWPVTGTLGIAELGGPHVGVFDPELAAAVAALVTKVVAAGAVIDDAGGRRQVTPADVGVVCSYVHQVAQVRAELPAVLRGAVLVETANRWQGLERDVIIGLHPLSGQPEPTAFAMEAGRLCVMCSRHRAACLLVGRPGLAAAAGSGAGAAERTLADVGGAAGWQAHSTLLELIAS